MPALPLRTDERREPADQRELWYRLATRCGAQIRKQCGGALAAETARRMVLVFRTLLRPQLKAGRKPDCVTVRAAELWVRYSGHVKREAASVEAATLEAVGNEATGSTRGIIGSLGTGWSYDPKAT